LTSTSMLSRLRLTLVVRLIRMLSCPPLRRASITNVTVCASPLA